VRQHGETKKSRSVNAEGGRRPTAFVSYAQSSRPWQELVLDFTVALRKPGGVDAEVDLFHDVDHQRWTTFGANLIEASDFTLIAIDRAYKRRWQGKEARGVGAGVAREAAAIRSIYDRDQDEFLKRIKLVLLPEIGEEEVPGDLLGDCERFVIDSFDLEGLERLLRSIHGRTAHPKPDLAPIPVLPPKAIARLEGKDSASLARSSGEVPGAKATDARDERNLRGQLRRVQGELKEARASEVRKNTLRREQVALEVSLEALAQAQRPRRRKARKGAPRRVPSAAPRKAVRWGLLLIVLGAAVATTALASPLFQSSKSSPHPFTARSTGVTLQGPSGWRQQAGRGGISGLEILAPVSLAPGAAQQGDAREFTAVAGISHATGAKLLPAAYREQLGESTEKAPVDLGSLEAYRYAGLKTATGYPLAMYVVPTSIGLAILACRMPKENTGAGSRLCSRIASTLRLTSGEAYPLGPSAAFAKAIRRQFKRLQRRQSKALQAMSKAKQAEAQGLAAYKLATIYRDASRALASIQITPESEDGRTAMVVALRRVRDAYKRLAVAARHEDEFAYAGAKRAVAAGERLMRKRLGQLRSLGYQVT
jgi:hypothetical protein